MQSKWEKHLDDAQHHLDIAYNSPEGEYQRLSLEIARIFVSMAHVAAIAEAGNGPGA